MTVASGRPRSAATAWRARGRELSLNRPIVMGILNVTPDSFSDGGFFSSPEAAVAHGERLLSEGADILDIGGESTRPQGAMPVAADEERRRVVPVLRELRRRCPHAWLSVDTVKADVAAAALDAGADIVNDVSGLRLDPALGKVVALAMAGLVLMHSRGVVADMATYAHARYGGDPVGEVLHELEDALGRAREAGVAEAAVAIDPGIGFSKTTTHSLALLRELPRLAATSYPVVVGVSRKRFIGEITGAALPADRLAGTIAANVLALSRGAHIFRVHDVRAHRQALDMAWEIDRTNRDG